MTGKLLHLREVAETDISAQSEESQGCFDPSSWEGVSVDGVEVSRISRPERIQDLLAYNASFGLFFS